MNAGEREALRPVTGDWSGSWSNWIAPFHFCPRCGESLNWRRGTDAFDRPMVGSRHCGLTFSAMMSWDGDPELQRLDKATPPAAAPTGERDAELATALRRCCALYSKCFPSGQPESHRRELDEAQDAFWARVAALRQEARGELVGTGFLKKGADGELRLFWQNQTPLWDAVAPRSGIEVEVYRATPGGADHA